MTESMRINLESRASIHFGIDYVMVPGPALDAKKFIEFQANLAKGGVDLPVNERRDIELHLARKAPHLKVMVKTVGPNVGQLLIISDNPEGVLSMFTREAEQICGAYEKTWGKPSQFLGRDAAINYLFSCEGYTHSFAYLWEDLLSRPGDQANLLGHPIAGGGLRFVMPPETGKTEEPTVREVKIESFLSDPAKLLVAIHLTWPRPTNEDMFTKCSELLTRADSYMSKEVSTFLTHREKKE